MAEPVTELWPVTLYAASWVDTADVAEQWPDAVDLEPTLVARVLAAAQEQCEAFAPALAPGQEVPASWKVAVVMQARAIYRATIAGSNDQIGADGLTVTVFPMDWTVQRLLRPKRGRIRVA
ncbi:hypothetical protein [Xylanimonas ulmi]|uniref:Head-to-tail adaptor n=1 Tax=Xylanimonas ulmi TaxID=228973 RepID=A0A4Q7LYS8_9MICO|nr:hypothetical protein [Xylanibacterium ulmi]RZS60456.1 hypothetical protein EV386_0714 [Xylanibacterium ulmi]